jgi:hypothetical protein
MVFPFLDVVFLTLFAAKLLKAGRLSELYEARQMDGLTTTSRFSDRKTF